MLKTNFNYNASNLHPLSHPGIKCFSFYKEIVSLLKLRTESNGNG